jgi:hypothetical protein
MTDEQLKQLLHAASALLQPHLREKPHLRTVARLAAQWLIEQAEDAERARGGVAVQQHPTPSAAEVLPERSLEAEQTLGGVEVPGGVVVPDGISPVATGSGSSPAIFTSEPFAPAAVSAGFTPIQPEDLNRVFTGPRVIAEAPAFTHQPRQTVETIGLEPLLDLFTHRFELQQRGCLLRVDMAVSPAEESVRARRKQLLQDKEQYQPVVIWAILPKFEPSPYCNLQVIARAYDACVQTTRLLKRTLTAGASANRHLPAVLQASATAGSALRYLLSTVSIGATEFGTFRDADQDQLAKVLMSLGAEHSLYIARHLRLEDPATESDLAALESSLPELVKRVHEDVSKVEDTKRKLKQLRYHVDQIAAGKTSNIDHDWNKIETVLAAAIAAGLPPSDRQLGAILNPLLEVIVPEHLKHTRHALSFEKQRALKTLDALQQPPEQGKTWSEGVMAVRRLIRGRQLVIIGGEQDDHQHRRIEEAFACTLHWVELTEHGPSEPMIAPIHAADTCLVLLIIRLTGHLHHEKARQAAIAANKPLVPLPQGWNPEVIAHEVLTQASEILKS